MVANKKVKTVNKKVTKKQTSVKYENKKHIYAGFLLGLCSGMLFFALYFVTLYCI